MSAADIPRRAIASLAVPIVADSVSRAGDNAGGRSGVGAEDTADQIRHGEAGDRDHRLRAEHIALRSSAEQYQVRPPALISAVDKLTTMGLPHRLKCAETWAGNEGTSNGASLPGLDVWVHSAPFGSDDAGGDVHFVSLCPSCIVSRIALADVSGHGRAVVSLGNTLRELMQTYLAHLEQTDLMRDLNEAVRSELDGVHYATMVAVGFHGRRGLLVMTNAGHPPAFWYRAQRNEWAWFEPHDGEGRAGIRGTPLGLLPNAAYDRMIVRPEPGDLIVLYSDGVSEATNPAGTELGREDLMTLARSGDTTSAETFGLQLVEGVRKFRGGTAPADDETVIVLQRKGIPSKLQDGVDFQQARSSYQ